MGVRGPWPYPMLLWLLLLLATEATAQAGEEVGGTLHRIGEGVISKYAEDAGLRLVRSSNMHINSEDTLTNGATDPSIQGRTSKFVLLFEK